MVPFLLKRSSLMACLSAPSPVTAVYFVNPFSAAKRCYKWRRRERRRKNIIGRKKIRGRKMSRIRERKTEECRDEEVGRARWREGKREEKVERDGGREGE